jgi:hypothetical protein
VDWRILCIILSITTLRQVFTKELVNFLPTPQKLTSLQQNGLFARIIYQIT